MDIRNEAVSGVKWTGASTGVITALQFLQLAVLARLLSPTDFGLMGMIMVVVGFAQSFADMGISNAIIHRQDTTKEQLSSLYWLNVAAGVVVFLAVVASKPLVGRLYGEPRLNELVFWAALVFLIIPFGQQFQILLQKNLRFDRIAWVEIVSTAAGTIVAVCAALGGAGVFSLIWALVTTCAVRSIMLVSMGWSKWRPGLRFRRSDLKGYLGFGLYQMGEKSIMFFNSRVDQLLIGSLLGAQALGYYSLAFQLVTRPMILINMVVTKVTFPIFSKIQIDVDRLQRGYLQVIRTLSSVNAPLLLGLAVMAPHLVGLFFGREWTQSIVLVQILALVALLKGIGNPVGSLLLARGRADLGFKWNLGLLIILPPAVYFGAKAGGLSGVAWTLFFLHLVAAMAAYDLLIRPLAGRCRWLYAESVLRPVGIAVLMAVVVWGLGFVGGEGAGLFVIRVVTGAVVFGALFFVLERRQYEFMKETIFTSGKARKRSMNGNGAEKPF